MVQLGFVSAILPGASIEKLIQFASKHDFKCIEAMCWPRGKIDRRYAGVTHIDPHTFDDYEVKRLKTLLEYHSVSLSALGYYPNILDADVIGGARASEHLKKVIQLASRLGVPVVNTFIGRDSLKSIDYNMDRFREIWPELIDFAEKLHIQIGIENCPMLFTQDEWPGGKNLAISPAIWDQMFEAIPNDNFGLNYDPSHLVWMQMDEIAPIYDYASRLKHIHLKDVKIKRECLNRVGILAYPLMFHEPKIPGLGDVRWYEFFNALRHTDYQGALCIEVEDRAFEDSESSRYAALISSKNYLTKYIQNNGITSL